MSTATRGHNFGPLFGLHGHQGNSSASLIRREATPFLHNHIQNVAFADENGKNVESLQHIQDVGDIPK